MSRRRPAAFIASLPRSVVALVWALAAMHWRSGKRFAGATYRGLSELLGTTHRSALTRVVAKAAKAGVVVVEGPEHSRWEPRRILLTHSTLQKLESTWRK